MFGIEKNIETIEGLLAEGSPQSITYAALECRLTIEQICYQRLSLAHDYISHDDIKKWQPRDVVRTLIQEVDPSVVSSLEVSIGEKSSKYYDDNPSEKVEYKEIGKQVGFDAKKMGTLWNALSHVSLHVQIPKSKNDNVVRYKNTDKAKRKIEECLCEFKLIAETTLMLVGFGPDVSFDCLGCDTINKRKLEMLDEGQVVNCINFDCDESYFFRKNAEDIQFERRKSEFLCSCGSKQSMSHNYLSKLKNQETRFFDCENCGTRVEVGWRLYKLKVEHP